MSVASPEHGQTTRSEPDRHAVRKQLDRLLENPYFSHSKRFPSFLRFVVEQTLTGDAEKIKERTLGIEIFGRDADYDTASDPIVRVTAAEIRKRVAQYYQDESHRDELRITLPSGSYIPQFNWPKESEEIALPDEGSDELEPGASPAPSAAHPQRHSVFVLALTCALACLASVGGVLIWQAYHRPAFDLFWQPILKAEHPVLLCIADQLQYSSIALRDAAEPTHQVLLNDQLTAIVVDDVYATVKVAGILQSSGKQYTVKGEGATNLEDLRNGPTVFIGAFDNAWTLRLTKDLRFHFANDANMTKMSIVDSMAPSQSHWVVDRSVQMATHNYRDYAIVARFTDGNTGKLTVILAGIGRGGTIAAGEFLTDPDDLALLRRAAHDAGDKKNMEIVLSTETIDDKPGSPKMEAAYFW